eukprot:2633381-Pleurochrysis_carterae.AAC.1
MSYSVISGSAMTPTVAARNTHGGKACEARRTPRQGKASGLRGRAHACAGRWGVFAPKSYRY